MDAPKDAPAGMLSVTDAPQKSRMGVRKVQHLRHRSRSSTVSVVGGFIILTRLVVFVCVFLFGCGCGDIGEWSTLGSIRKPKERGHLRSLILSSDGPRSGPLRRVCCWGFSYTHPPRRFCFCFPSWIRIRRDRKAVHFGQYKKTKEDRRGVFIILLSDGPGRSEPPHAAPSCPLLAVVFLILTHLAAFVFVFLLRSGW